MQRVNRATAVPTMPAPPTGGAPGYFTGGNPGLGQEATVAGFEWFNAVQEELMGLILAGGLAPSGVDLAQVRKSLDRMYGGGLNAFSSNTILTNDHAGVVLVDTTLGPRTITLPPANGLANRSMQFFIINFSNSNPVTVQISGADNIEGNTSIVLNALYSSILLVSDGNGSWLSPRGRLANTSAPGITRFATPAETDAGTLADVAVTPAGLGIATRNYANPGYARLPGGLILQWGETGASDIGSGGSNLSATFPIAFPNALLNLQATEKSSTFGNFSITNVSGTLTGMTVSLTEWAAVVQSASVAYLAIGR